MRTVSIQVKAIVQRMSTKKIKTKHNFTFDLKITSKQNFIPCDLKPHGVYQASHLSHCMRYQKSFNLAVRDLAAPIIRR